MNGDLFQIKEAFSTYLAAWYSSLYPDTPALQEFTARGLSRSIVWAPDRMVDQAEAMLASYRKNSNSPVPNKSALFPIIIVAMAKDYSATTGDRGGRQVGRRLVRLTDAEDASVYGYRQAMGDIRTQVAIFGSEDKTVGSLAAQFTLWLGEIENRRFFAPFTWGGYTVQMPVMTENPDIIFQSVATDQNNITILAGDVNLQVTIPYFDAPKTGEPNDGSSNNPPGYPVITEVDVIDQNALTKTIVT